MFHELLALELELRRERGEDPGRDEYVAEFPDRAAVVATIFAELESSQERRPPTDRLRWRGGRYDGPLCSP